VIGRKLAALRRRVTKHCEVCGKEFTGIVTRRYCGNACRLHASRQRRSEHASERIPALVARLDATREAISKGRIFSNSVDLIDDLRNERMAEL